MQKMIHLHDKAQQLIQNMLEVVGIHHVLASTLMDLASTAAAMRDEYNELWEILEAQTKPQEAKKEFQEVEK
jgi:hypothetical protein